jgi:hypothetical protein
VTGLVAVAGGLVLVGAVAAVVPRFTDTAGSSSVTTEEVGPQTTGEHSGTRASERTGSTGMGEHSGARTFEQPPSGSVSTAQLKEAETDYLNAVKAHLTAVAPVAAVAVATRNPVWMEQVGGSHGTYPFTGHTRSASRWLTDEQVGGRHLTYAWTPPTT